MSKKKTNPSLRRFYAQGKRALDHYRRMKRQGESIYGALPRQGVQTLSEKNRLFEARRFAKLYEGPQLEWICELGQKRGRPLTNTHVLQLIRVPSRTDRNRLAQKCAEEEWSSGRLELEIARILPGRRYSGAPYKVPASVDRMTDTPGGRHDLRTRPARSGIAENADARTGKTKHVTFNRKRPANEHSMIGDSRPLRTTTDYRFDCVFRATTAKTSAKLHSGEMFANGRRRRIIVAYCSVFGRFRP